MSRDAGTPASNVSRRNYLLTSAVLGTAGLAGCSGNSGGSDDGETEDGSNTVESGSAAPATVTAEGSSTVYPISNKGSSYWNSNSPASDGEYWGSNSEGSVAGWDQIETDQNIADYFASLYGFEPSGERSNPPFATRVALSHSGTGCEAVRDGLVDIGNSSGPITAELDISEEQRDENYVDHVVGRDGQPVFVSQEIYDAGVEQLTGDQIRGIYQGDVTNWSEVGGPDQEIYVVGRAEGSGTDTSFRLNMLGDADAPMDVDTRKGQNQQVKTVLQQNDNAIGYMALAFQGSGISPIAIDFEGTVYEPS